MDTARGTVVLSVAAAAAVALAALPPDPVRAAGEGREAAPPTLLEVLVPETPALHEPRALAFGPAAFDGLQGFVVSVGEGAILTPAVDGTRLFAGSGLEIHCYMAMGGKRGWSRKVDDSQPTAPAVEDGQVYFNTQSCTLYDVDAETGDLRWQEWVAGSVNSTPAVAGGRVYVSGPGEGGAWKIEAREARTGKLLFRKSLPADVVSAPVAADGRVYCTLADGSVRALDPEGNPLWETAAGDPSTRVLAAPTPHEGRLLLAAGGSDGEPGLLDLDAAIGKSPGRAVATPPDRRQGMAAGDVGRKGGNGPGAAGPKPGPAAAPKDPVRDRPNGPAKGGKGNPSDPPAPPTPPGGSGAPPRPPVGGFGYEGPRPVVLRGTVAVAGSASLLLRPLAGGAERRLEIEDGPAGPPAAAGSLFVLATRRGRLLGIDPADGTIRFEMRFRGRGGSLSFSSSPAVSRGRAYVGTADGRVVAADLPEHSLDGWPMWGGSPSRAK